MIYIILGVLLISCGLGHRLYRMYIRYKNKQAKIIINEVKQRVKDGNENEVYLDLLEEAAYSVDVYKALKNSRMSKSEIIELLQITKDTKVAKMSKVKGLSLLALRTGRVLSIVSFIVGLIVCLFKVRLEPFFSFINALVVSQMIYFITIIFVESIKELVRRRCKINE